MSLGCKVTVYIASHNYGRFAEEAIASVFRQTMSDWELLLINDGSSDDTKKIFDRYADADRVQVIHTDGIGLPSVNNLALRNARGKYLVRLDADDYFDENILLILSNYLDHDDDLAVVFPDYYLVDENGGIFSHEWRSRLHLKDKVLDEPPNGACTMIRAEVLRKVGAYREDLGAQDGLDLWLKIKDSYGSRNVNLPLFYYRRHGLNLTDKPMKIVNARRSLKRDAALKDIDQVRPVIALIPCRRRNDFVEDLWEQQIAGKSLLARAIETCLASDAIDKVVVACDNLKAEQELVPYKHDSRLDFMLREESLALPSVSILDTLNLVVERYDSEGSGLILVNYIQSPFMTHDTLEEALTSLILSDSDSAFSIEKIQHEIYRRDEGGLKPIPTMPGSLAKSESLYRDRPPVLQCVQTSSTTGRNVLRTQLVFRYRMQKASS